LRPSVFIVFSLMFVTLILLHWRNYVCILYVNGDMTSMHFIFIQVYRGLKSCTSLLENAFMFLPTILGISYYLVFVLLINTVLLLGAPMLPTRWVNILTICNRSSFAEIFILMNVNPLILCVNYYYYYIIIVARALEVCGRVVFVLPPRLVTSVFVCRPAACQAWPAKICVHCVESRSMESKSLFSVANVMHVFIVIAYRLV
jgi:hypothetical protein